MKPDILFQFFKDSRNLHLWLLSSFTPHEFGLCLAKYDSFGHVGSLAGFRNVVASELSKEIAFESTRIVAVKAMEKKTLAAAMYMIARIRGYNEVKYIFIPNMRPNMVYLRQLIYNEQTKAIIENMFYQHNMQRYQMSLTQKILYPRLEYTPPEQKLVSGKYLVFLAGL